MHDTHRRGGVFSAFFCPALLLQACGNRPAASTGSDHIRGTIVRIDGQVLTVATSTGSVEVQLTQPTRVAPVVQADRERLTDGSFLGITSLTQKAGSSLTIQHKDGTSEGSQTITIPLGA
jgi:hypothetical protein